MTKSTKKQSGNQQVKQKQKQKPKIKRSHGVMPSPFSRYRHMLADPCAGPLVSAPYAGIGSSYLVRTINTVTGLAAAGTSGGCDFAFEMTPWNLPTIGTLAVGLTGSAMATSTTYSATNFVTGLSVRSFRPVAACLKFVPTGTISARSGVIGMGYSPDKMFQNGLTTTAGPMLSASLQQNPTGSVPHEILWLPSFEDERFGTQAETNVNGAGSCQIIGMNVDATLSGSVMMVNGYLEITVVWEWQPAYSVSGQNNGIVPAPMSPTSTTLNQALSLLGDAGRFVLQHAGTAMVREAYSYAAGAYNRHGPGLLMNR